jgi:LysM repeat protein
MLMGLCLVGSACASATDSRAESVPIPGAAASQSEPEVSDATPDTPSGATPETTAVTTTPDSTIAPSSTTTPDSTTTTTTSTTTSTVPELDVFEPRCVVEVQPGDSLGGIADEFDDPTVNIPTIQAENGLTDDVIYPGQLLDVCVDNGLDDRTGAETAPNQAIVDAARTEAVKAQQTKLNELFAGYGIRELLVDGVSGPVTQQRLCAARLALNLPVTRADMEAGSEEEQLLMSTEAIRQPFTSALNSERWILIDRTCQIMFAGEGDNGITFIFPTSTGEAGFETRDQDRSRAFRFDPALGNGGWHNSTTYPVAIDNPLNGNMYKPLYFDGGQAIHGSNNVPTTPQSKGCARLRVEDQDRLVAWLGLADAAGPTGDSRRINVTVNVQGSYD